MESKIRLPRLGLSQLGTASPMLRALLQEGSMRLSWTKAVAGDLVARQAVQPHPAGDVDVWFKLAVENKVSWRQLVKPVLTHLGSPALETSETARCPDFHKYFLIQALGAHRARVHGVYRLARTVMDRSGICPVRGKE